MPIITTIPYPKLDGHRLSFASIEAKFNNSQITGIKSVNYSDGLEPGIIKGTAPQALGRTRGDYTASCSFEMYRWEWEVFKQTLGKGGVGFMEISFDIIVTYAEPGSLTPSPTITDVVQSARISKVDSSNAEGTDGSLIKCDCNVISPILWNGVPGILVLAPKGF